MRTFNFDKEIKDKSTRTFTIILALSFAPLMHALEPRLEPPNVTTAVGEYFYIQVHIDDFAGADCRIEFPQNSTFEITEAGVSQTQSVRIIGSQVERSHTWIRNYRIRAKEAGEFTLGPVRCTVAGSVYETGSSAIHVQAETQKPPGGGRSGLLDFFQRDPLNRGDDRVQVYVETLFDKKSAWVGEGVVQYVDIHASRPRILGVQFAQVSRDGFWEILPEKYEQSRPLRYTRDGKEWYRYRYAVAYLFPLTGDDRVLPPFGVRVDYNQFWTRTQVFQTDPLRLQVRPLPPDTGRDFSGAVGNFTLAGDFDEDGEDFAQDKALTLVLTASGYGNIRSLQAPVFSETADFRIMPPQRNTEVRIQDGRVYGRQIFRYLIYPLRIGKMRLPEARLRAFDPVQGRYYDLVYTSPILDIAPPRGGLNGNEEQSDREEYHYDFTPPESDSPPAALPLPLLPSFALLAGALGVFLWGITRERQRRFDANNPRLALRARAAKHAGDMLRALPDEPARAASEIARALRRYAGDRTGLGEGATFPVLAEALAGDGVDEKNIEEWKNLEERSTALSYGGLSAHDETPPLLESARRLLKHFEESRS